MTQHGWRSMTGADIPSVANISDTVHGRYTERAEVYAERRRLYPAGCFVLEGDGGLAGYLICHPWRGAAPPALNALIGAVPANADCFYLHDLALLPTARGQGAGALATQMAVAAARTAGQREIRLVAVNGAESFWATQGFVAMTGEEAVRAAETYGAESQFLHRLLTADEPST